MTQVSSIVKGLLVATAQKRDELRQLRKADEKAAGETSPMLRTLLRSRFGEKRVMRLNERAVNPEKLKNDLVFKKRPKEITYLCVQVKFILAQEHSSLAETRFSILRK